MCATYGMPMIVEFGVALDVLVAVLVLGIFFFQIREQFDSLDLYHLESLKENLAAEASGIENYGEYPVNDHHSRMVKQVLLVLDSYERVNPGLS